MKKVLIIAAMSSMLFAACSGEAKKESGTDSTMTAPSTLDTTSVNPDSSIAAADSMAVDSATAAHGHSH